MNAIQEQAVSVLRDLVATCRDGQQGFRTASEYVADDPELKMLLSSFSLQSSKFAGELENELIGLGEHQPERGGSISGSMRRGWLNLKAAVGRMDNHAILAECESEADYILAEYNKSLTHDLPDPIRQTVQRQRGEVVTTHNTIKALRDTTPGQTAQVLESLRKGAAEAGQAIQQKAGEVATGAAQVWSDTKEKAQELQQKSERYVRQNPLPSVFGAILVGFSIGMLFYAIELRNEQIRLQMQRRPLRRIGTMLAGWLGFVAGRARSGYKSSVEQVQEVASKAPRQIRRQSNRFTRPFRTAWERVMP